VTRWAHVLGLSANATLHYNATFNWSGVVRRPQVRHPASQADWLVWTWVEWYKHEWGVVTDVEGSGSRDLISRYRQVICPDKHNHSVRGSNRVSAEYNSSYAPPPTTSKDLWAVCVINVMKRRYWTLMDTSSAANWLLIKAIITFNGTQKRLRGERIRQYVCQLVSVITTCTNKTQAAGYTSRRQTQGYRPQATEWRHCTESLKHDSHFKQPNEWQ
jgi:hypothetical protein